MNGMTSRAWDYMVDHREENLESFNLKYWKGATLEKLTKKELQGYFSYCVTLDISRFN